MPGAGSGNWITGLLQPEAYAHPCEKLELVETHISWVILTGSYAYKIKKPVRFVFVDFTTLEARQHACFEEIRLNRRWRDSIYIEVCPITGSTQAPRMGGEGEAFEYAVRMHQFDPGMLLSHCIERGRLLASHLEVFGLDLARFHQAAAGRPAQPLGTPGAVRKVVMDNFDMLFSGELPAEDQRLAERVRAYAASWFDDHHELLARRRIDGFVRECHGDLHLNNMLLRDGRIELFDCLEFNAALRWGDVMNEVAFLVMDLESHGRRDLARRFLNAYVEHSGDHAGLGVLPFYLSYRAMVRAKVDQLTRIQAGDDRPRTAALLRELEGYLDEAASYSREARPRLAVMSGLSGSGKTWLSVQLVGHGFIRIRSDFERRRLTGTPLDVPVQGDRPAPLAEAEPYAEAVTRATYQAVAERAALCLEAGFSVVVDATCLKTWQRRQFLELADRLGVPLRLFVLEHAAEELETRIRERAAGARDLSEADVRVLHMQMDAREALEPGECRFATVIDQRETDPAEVIGAWLEEG